VRALFKKRTGPSLRVGFVFSKRQRANPQPASGRRRVPATVLRARDAAKSLRQFANRAERSRNRCDHSGAHLSRLRYTGCSTTFVNTRFTPSIHRSTSH